MIHVIEDKLKEVSSSYYRLLLLVENHDKPLTDVIERIASAIHARRINFSAELSSALLDMPSRQRGVRVARIASEIIGSIESDTVLLEHIDLIFTPSLQQDPLALLKAISRNKTVIAIWPGSTDGATLTHGEEWHPEYLRYNVDDFEVISLDSQAV